LNSEWTKIDCERLQQSICHFEQRTSSTGQFKGHESTAIESAAGRRAVLSSTKNMSTETHKRLVLEAWELKRAWLLAGANMGIGHQMTEKEHMVPNYVTCDDTWLKHHIRDLKISDPMAWFPPKCRLVRDGRPNRLRLK